MASYSTQAILPVPLAAVVPAASQATVYCDLWPTTQEPLLMKCHSKNNGFLYSPLLAMITKVSLELRVSGVDGQATVTIDASNHGFGPLAKPVRDKADQLLAKTTEQLQRASSSQAQVAAPFSR